MKLSEKMKHLRHVEGIYRELDHDMTIAEVLRAMREELGESISHAYLWQLENDKRTHMSPRTRQLLAKFFKVHPGYLVSDPEGFQPTVSATEMLIGARDEHSTLRRWLQEGALVLNDVSISRSLRHLATSPDPERYLHLLAALSILEEDSLNEIEQRITAERTKKIHQNGTQPHTEDV